MTASLFPLLENLKVRRPGPGRVSIGWADCALQIVAPPSAVLVKMICPSGENSHWLGVTLPRVPICWPVRAFQSIAALPTERVTSLSPSDEKRHSSTRAVGNSMIRFPDNVSYSDTRPEIELTRRTKFFTISDMPDVLASR